MTDKAPSGDTSTQVFFERVKYSLSYLSSAAFKVPYNPVHYTYEKKQLEFNF